MKTLIAAIVLSTYALGAMAQAGAPAAYQPCAACHGAVGQGDPAQNAPALAGQDAPYLERQLANFRSGLRGADPADTAGAQMRAMTATLEPAAAPQVAAWLAAQPAPQPAPAQGTDLRNGESIYHGRCGACHGGAGEGNPGLNSPRLNTLDAAYLKRQFANFLQGVRGSHPDDTYGRQMKMMAATLPGEKDLDDVIAFIHAQAQQD